MQAQQMNDEWRGFYTHRLVLDMSKGALVNNEYTFYNLGVLQSQNQVRLQKVLLPFTFYNITNQFSNNTAIINFQQDLQNRQITIADGYYTRQQLTDQIVSQFQNEHGFTLSFSYNQNSGKLSLSCEESNIQIDTNSVLTSMLGFELRSDYSVSINGQKMVDMMPIKFCLIFSNNVGFNILNNSQTAFITYIPITGNFGDWISFQSEDNNAIFLTQQSLNSMVFQFQDQNLRPINFNGFHPVIELNLND